MTALALRARNAYRSLVRLGVSDEVDSRTRRYVQLLNTMCVMIAVFDIAFVVLFAIRGIPYLCLMFGLSALGYGVLLPLLNSFRMIALSRLIFAAMGVGLMFMVANYLGEGSYAHVVLIVASCSPFCMISPREFRLWVPAILLPIAAYLVLYAVNFSIGPQLGAEVVAANADAIRHVMWIFTFAFVSSITFFFTNQEYQFEMRLTKSIDLLKAENEARVKVEGQLRSANREVDMLVSILSHDMASYITSVVLSSGRLASDLGDGLSQKQNDYLGRIRNAGDGMTQLIRHVRKLRMIALGLDELVLEAVPLGRVIEQVRSIYVSQMEEKGVELKVETTLDLAAVAVRADETTLINQVIGNLVSNSIKFSKAGDSIVIAADDVEGRIQLEVRDQGIGIPPHIVKDLFDISKKTSRRGTSGEKGTGFGLPLCQHYCHQYGGSIAVHSVTADDGSGESPGTTFTVTLDRA